MEDYYIVMLCFLVTTGPIGVLTNAAFIVLTLCKSELRKDYSWFLCGMSISNIMYSFNMAVPQVFVIMFDIDPKNQFCQVIGVIVLMNGVCSVCIQPFLSLNRFIMLYHSHLQGKYFTRTKILLMIISVYAICLALSLVLLAMGDVGRVGHTICGPQIEDMPISHVCLFTVPMFFSYGVSIYCGYKILNLINAHQTAARERDLGSRLQDAKDIFRLIVIELAVPICFETPALLSCMLSGVTYVPKLIIAFTVGLFLAHPLIDPIIVIVVMKPYRRCVMNIWLSLRGIQIIQVQPISTFARNTRLQTVTNIGAFPNS